MKKVNLVLLAVLNFTIAACMTTGKDIDARDLRQLSVGRSTLDQVVRKFGAPRSEVSSEGVCGPKSFGKMVTYDSTSIFKNRTQAVMLKFNSKDVLCAKPMMASARPFQ